MKNQRSWAARIAVRKIPKIKFDLRNYLAYLEKQVELCQEQYQLQVHKNTTVTAELLKEKAYDSVILRMEQRNLSAV